jgi:hypothetical protein
MQFNFSNLLEKTVTCQNLFIMETQKFVVTATKILITI